MKGTVNISGGLAKTATASIILTFLIRAVNNDK